MSRKQNLNRSNTFNHGYMPHGYSGMGMRHSSPQAYPDFIGPGGVPLRNISNHPEMMQGVPYTQQRVPIQQQGQPPMCSRVPMKGNMGACQSPSQHQYPSQHMNRNGFSPNGNMYFEHHPHLQRQGSYPSNGQFNGPQGIPAYGYHNGPMGCDNQSKSRHVNELKAAVNQLEEQLKRIKLHRSLSSGIHHQGQNTPNPGLDTGDAGPQTDNSGQMPKHEPGLVAAAGTNDNHEEKSTGPPPPPPLPEDPKANLAKEIRSFDRSKLRKTKTRKRQSQADITETLKVALGKRFNACLGRDNEHDSGIDGGAEDTAASDNENDWK